MFRRVVGSAVVAALLYGGSIPAVRAWQCPAKSLRVEPGHAAPGSIVTVTGQGWFAGACDATSEGPEHDIKLSLVEGDEAWFLRSVDASTKPGPFYMGFRTTVQIPESASPGPGYIVASGPTKSARKGFRVIAAELPSTGLAAAPPALAGLLLLAAVLLSAPLRRGRRSD